MSGTSVWRKFQNLWVSQKLKLGPNASIDANGTDVSLSELTALGGTTATATELNYLDGSTPGTGTASNAMVADSRGNFDSLAGAEINGIMNRKTHYEVFDDFLAAAIDTTNNWIVFAGTDGDATAGAAVAGVPEGQINMGSGDGGSTEDGSVLSLILLSQGSLVSLGKTVFECRVSLSQLTGVAANFGLSDTLATTAEHLLHTVDSGTVADGGLTVTNAITWAFSSDATATTTWQYTHENAGTIGNSAAEEANAAGPTADTYAVLRIEVDATGDARWYLDGTLQKTETTAVATTALLIPYIGIDAGTDAQTVTDLHIDYIYFAGARPSSDA